jgi:hypothetical protein
MEEQEEVKKELEIDYKIDGFLKDAKYSAHILDVIRQYKEKFIGAEKLTVTIHESSLYELNNPVSKKQIDIYEDRKSISISFDVNKYYDTKNKVTGIPEPFDVFTTLRFILDKAVKEYNAPKVVE